ncbi:MULTISPECIES: hypothetical protein [unclassified Pseudofrankia]|uniref:hypothetical protein n=1 Tax=unclassified Pseudofrankia TaxID=2994372 RepID=UPI0008D90AD6|nr:MULTISPECIES: hypothetical protein [unclassified Pseudofrankia]MDT3444858.1 hypothetical protein [Pseudofrankia sp. BMG5.37]OHV74221.1 hypothetical protein BCD48_32605 [Pseudofrankia sp. BMG5.36]
MNAATEHSPGSRLHDLADEVFGPVRAPRGTLERKLLLVRSAFAYGGLIATLVQVVVWLTIGVITAHLDSPWWLWTAVPAAAVVGLLTLARRWQHWWGLAEATKEESR